MESIIDQIKQYASSADETSREGLAAALRRVLYSLEDDDDIVHRIGYLPLQSSAVRTGINLKLFELLAGSETALTVEDIVKATGANSTFLVRLLRYLASSGYVEETGKHTFAANHTTKLLAVKGNQAGLCHIFDTCGPLYQEMPKFLRETDYNDITDNKHTVWQQAFQTSLGPFQWFANHLQELENFNNYMAARRQAAETWLSVYPVEEETKDWNPELPVYVNIGGSIGHQCAEFKQKYPHVPGRVILQDLQHSIDHALQTPGVENMVHNFFQPQPVKGAKFYFLRTVLHDHPDERVKLILRNTKEAMSKDSVLLIDEMVLPDTGVHSHIAAVDLTMMSACAGGERTESHWRSLLESVGLKLIDKFTYKPAVYETVMKAVPV